MQQEGNDNHDTAIDWQEVWFICSRVFYVICWIALFGMGWFTASMDHSEIATASIFFINITTLGVAAIFIFDKTYQSKIRFLILCFISLIISNWI